MDRTDDERLADAMRQLLERYGDLHVIVTEYVSALADAGRAPATIERALAAIAAAHRAAGAGTLRTDGPRQVLRSYRRDRATTGTGVRVRTRGLTFGKVTLTKIKRQPSMVVVVDVA